MANDSWISFSHFQCVSERIYEKTCLPFLSFSFPSFGHVMPPFPILPSASLRVPCCLHWLALLCQLKVVLIRKLVWLLTSCMSWFQSTRQVFLVLFVSIIKCIVDLFSGNLPYIITRCMNCLHSYGAIKTMNQARPTSSVFFLGAA